jgi:hypothetical protein
MDRRSFLAERLIPDIIQSNQIHVDCSPPLAMDQANHQAARLRFGVFEADLGARELTKLGKLLPLQEQPFQLLAMLLEKPGVLVTREELRARLWPQTVVDFDHGLNKAISKIRDGLGDSAENPPLHSNRGAARLPLLGRRHEDRPRTGQDRDRQPDRTPREGIRPGAHPRRFESSPASMAAVRCPGDRRHRLAGVIGGNHSLDASDPAPCPATHSLAGGTAA